MWHNFGLIAYPLGYILYPIGLDNSDSSDEESSHAGMHKDFLVSKIVNSQST